jgi:hypothetical protein
MGTQRVTRTVKVVLHLDEAGGLAVGVVGAEHVGKRRIDTRYIPAGPVPYRLASAPRGVPAHLWAAHLALCDAVARLEAEAASRQV